MPPTVPSWQFILEIDRMWRWRAFGIVSDPFVRREGAMENAAQCGFDPLSCYWIVTANGRTTHYLPGKPPVNLPEGVPLDE